MLIIPRYNGNNIRLCSMIIIIMVQMSQDVKLSKALVKVLRHSATQSLIDKAGFVRIDALASRCGVSEN